MRRNPQALTEREFDVAVIGGGIVGACVARDAATRGLSVALIEKRDFSSGTSSASSRMVHGGVRYLAQLQLAVVRESLRERRIWQQAAPHLIRPLPFVLPVTTARERFEARVGLTMFDLLAWDRGRLQDPEQRLPAHRWWYRAEAISRIPALLDSATTGAVCYADCQATSPERVCIECLHDAAEHGAVIANYIACTGILQRHRRVTGLAAHDGPTGNAVLIRARSVVNATGPWADSILHTVDGISRTPRLVRSKGAHILVRRLAADYALFLRHHGRHAFVLPWRGLSLIGTTDTPYNGDPDLVRPEMDDVRELLDIVNAALPSAHLLTSDVRYAYAGLRPLVADGTSSSYRMSRRAEIVDHGREGGPHGLISALGGKWTTARHIAEQVVDLVTRQLGAGSRPCTTRERPLPGGDFGTLSAFRARLQSERMGVDRATAEHLGSIYGARYRQVVDVAAGDSALVAALAPGIPDIGAEVVYAVREEQALHLLDVLLRRTGIGTMGAPSSVVLDRLTGMMAMELGWSAADVERERSGVEAHYRIATEGMEAEPQEP